MFKQFSADNQEQRYFRDPIPLEKKAQPNEGKNDSLCKHTCENGNLQEDSALEFVRCF
jgi:hypothetical protein